MARKLTGRQKEVLDFIEQTQRETTMFPSMQEIADYFGFKSINAVQDHIRRLCKKGVLEKLPGKARAYRIKTPLLDLRENVIHIPVYGSIPAGYADGRDELDPEACVSVDVGTMGISPSKNMFGLRVTGDSMIDRHICDGDLVICESGRDPKNGDAVAALIDRENTLKTYVKNEGQVFLKAENAAYPNLIPAEELLVQGVVVGVIRNRV